MRVMFEKQFPCRVSLDLRAREAAEERLPVPSEEDMRDARQEIEEELLAGKRIGRIDLEALIDCELDRNYAATLRRLYEHFAGIGTLSAHDQAIRCQAADEWLTRLVRAHLDTDADAIEERAARIAAERGRE
jgi:hypothetical protein